MCSSDLVKVTTMNNLSGDRMIDELSPSRDSIQITGAESVVSTVGYALLTVDLENISKNMAQTCRVTLYTDDDTLVDSALVTPEEENLDVTVGVNHVVTVPLQVTLTPSASLTRDMVEAIITPKTLRVFGSKDIVDSLGSISLGSIDLSQVTSDGQEFKLTARLPSGVQLMSGESKEASVRITMKDDISRTLEVSQITLHDTSTDENKPEVTLNTASVSVEVTGKADVISKISASDLLVDASLDSSALGAGTHAVQATVTTSASGITVKTTEVTVNVTIAAQEEATEGS